jgi:hypothetical protein
MEGKHEVFLNSVLEGGKRLASLSGCSYDCCMRHCSNSREKSPHCYLDMTEYCDMTPESRNSLLLDNGGKQVPVEMYTCATIEEL